MMMQRGQGGVGAGGMETLINAKMGFVYFFHFPLGADV